MPEVKNGYIGGEGSLPSIVAFKNNKSFLVGTPWKGIQVYEDGALFYEGEVSEGENCIQNAVYAPKHCTYLVLNSNRVYRKDVDDKPAYLWVKDLQLGVSAGKLPMLYSEEFGDSLVVQKTGSGKIGVVDLSKGKEAFEIKMEHQDVLMAHGIVTGFEEVQKPGGKERELLTVTRNGWLYIHRFKGAFKSQDQQVDMAYTAWIPLDSTNFKKASQPNSSPIGDRGEYDTAREGQNMEVGLTKFLDPLSDIGGEEVNNICFYGRDNLCLELSDSKSELCSRLVVLRLVRNNRTKTLGFVTKAVLDVLQSGLSASGELVCSGRSHGRLLYHGFHHDLEGKKDGSVISTFSYSMKTRQFGEIRNLRTPHSVGRIQCVRKIKPESEKKNRRGAGNSQDKTQGYYFTGSRVKWMKLQISHN